MNTSSSLPGLGPWIVTTVGVLLGGCPAEVEVLRDGEVVPSCTEDVGVRPVDRVLALADDPCQGWVEDVVIHAARDGVASGVLWTRRTQPGTGLLLTMAATWSRCREERNGNDDPNACPARWSDPQAVLGRTEVRLAHPEGGQAELETRATFHLFEPAQPAPADARELAPLSSAFVMHVLDSQAFSDDEVWTGTRPEALTDTPLEIDDPGGSTTRTPSWADAETDTSVLALGFAASGEEAGRLQASVSTVLGAEEARYLLSALPPNDVESKVPFDPDVELVARGEAVVGMGGAGVFDRQGRLVGVLLRSFTPPGREMHLRAVRMSFIVRMMTDTLASLPDTERARAQRYLPLP